MRKSCGNCRRRNSLASRVHQNSPRTPLSASNHMTLRQRCCAARFQPQGRKPYGPGKGPCVAPAQEFRVLPCVCLGLMVGDGKPKSTQDWMVPCATAEHQLPLRTSLTAWTLTRW